MEGARGCRRDGERLNFKTSPQTGAKRPPPRSPGSRDRPRTDGQHGRAVILTHGGGPAGGAGSLGAGSSSTRQTPSKRTPSPRSGAPHRGLVRRPSSPRSRRKRCPRFELPDPDLAPGPESAAEAEPELKLHTEPSAVSALPQPPLPPS